ncbi:hypothetical protein ACWA7J_13965 [Leptothrix sp. BB-4]
MTGPGRTAARRPEDDEADLVAPAPADAVGEAAPVNLGEELMRDAVPRGAAAEAAEAASRWASDPSADADADGPESNDQPWYTGTGVLLGGGAAGLAVLASLGGKSSSPAAVPVVASSAADYYTFRVTPMAGRMTGLKVRVLDIRGEFRDIDPAAMTVDARTGEIRFRIARFGALASGEPVRIEVRDGNGEAPNFDDEHTPNPAGAAFDTGLGETVLSAWVGRAPGASNDSTQTTASPKVMTVSPLTTAAAHYIDQLMLSDPALFATPALADQAITAVHRAIADQFSELGAFDLVNSTPVPVNADSAAPNAYGKALGILSYMASSERTPGLDGVITFLQDNLVAAAGGDPIKPVLRSAAKTELDLTGDTYFQSALVSSNIQSALAKVAVVARSPAMPTVGEQIDPTTNTIAYTSLADGLTLQITPAKGATKGTSYLLRFHPLGVEGRSLDYTYVYTMETAASTSAGSSTPTPLLVTLPLFARDQGIVVRPDASGNTLALKPGAVPADVVSRYDLSIEPGANAAPDFVLPAIRMNFDHRPVAITSVPEINAFGNNRYRVGEEIRVKVLLPTPVNWGFRKADGSVDVTTNAPQLRLDFGSPVPT